MPALAFLCCAHHWQLYDDTVPDMTGLTKFDIISMEVLGKFKRIWNREYSEYRDLGVF